MPRMLPVAVASRKVPRKCELKTIPGTRKWSWKFWLVRSLVAVQVRSMSALKKVKLLSSSKMAFDTCNVADASCGSKVMVKLSVSARPSMRTLPVLISYWEIKSVRK